MPFEVIAPKTPNKDSIPNGQCKATMRKLGRGEGTDVLIVTFALGDMERLGWYKGTKVKLFWGTGEHEGILRIVTINKSEEFYWELKGRGKNPKAYSVTTSGLPHYLNKKLLTERFKHIMAHIEVSVAESSLMVRFPKEFILDKVSPAR